jgi:hypothetical protein
MTVDLVRNGNRINWTACYPQLVTTPSRPPSHTNKRPRSRWRSRGRPPAVTLLTAVPRLSWARWKRLTPGIESKYWGWVSLRSHFLTWGRRRIKFPKRCVFLEHRAMDNVHEASNSECYAPSSESFRIREKNITMVFICIVGYVEFFINCRIVSRMPVGVMLLHVIQWSAW